MGELLELAPNPEISFAALPPREVWLPRKEKLETPVDELGRVNRFMLVELVRSTVDPDFSWPIDEGNIHHLYWPEVTYPYNPRNGSVYDPNNFRNRCNHMIRIPIMFHNWIHRVTIPPASPSVEVMAHMTEASMVASNALATLTATINHERNSRRILRKMSKMTEAERRAYYYRGKRPTSKQGVVEVAEKSEIAFQVALERMRSIPKEFQLVNPDLSRMSLRRELGRIVGVEKEIGALPMFNEVARKLATAPASSSAQTSRVA